MITVVGQCVGARDYEQAVHYTRKLTLWAYLTIDVYKRQGVNSTACSVQ